MYPQYYPHSQDTRRYEKRKPCVNARPHSIRARVGICYLSLGYFTPLNLSSLKSKMEWQYDFMRLVMRFM